MLPLGCGGECRDGCISAGWLGGLFLTINDIHAFVHTHTHTHTDKSNPLHTQLFLHPAQLIAISVPHSPALSSSSHETEELKCKSLRVKPRRTQTETINPLLFLWPWNWWVIQGFWQGSTLFPSTNNEERSMNVLLRDAFGKIISGLNAPRVVTASEVINGPLLSKYPV